jgi:3-hydroxyisobutyrate dehydrogenase-like beta-hydroxyacid dehydrogenase
MGLPMTGNLVKKGFEVKAFDLNPLMLEKLQELVTQFYSYLIHTRELNQLKLLLRLLLM